MRRWMFVAVILLLTPSMLLAQAKAKKAKKAAGPRLQPTVADYKYADDSDRQRLDFWQAKSDKPTPVVLLIHGGGWVGGDKSGFRNDQIKPFLDAGISVAAIDYRFIAQAMQQKVEPPVKAPLMDNARALQTIRSKAKEWNIDPKRIGATGGSAGGASTCWLCTHDDLADPSSADPIARESTRLLCGAPVGAQTCFDPQLLREWLPNMSYGGHAYGFSKFQDFYDGRDKVMHWVKEYSPYHLVTKDDSPMFLQYSLKNNEPPVLGKPAADPTHSAVLGIKFAEKLKEAGVEYYLCYPGGPQTPWTSATQFLIARLKGDLPK